MIDMSKLYNHSDYSLALAKFIRNNKWSEFQKVHLKVAKNKCPICECSLDGSISRKSNNGITTIEPTIDHYRPKDDNYYPLLKFDHTNYLLMCSDCNNRYKNNEFPLYDKPLIREITVKETKYIVNERPLIVNPIYDKPLDLFKLEFKYTTSGKKVLELAPKYTNGYQRAKAEETIRLFGLGKCDETKNSNPNVHNCRISVLNSHFKRFYKFIKAIENKDKRKALMELKIIKANKFDEYGFYDFIKENQYKNYI